MKREGNQKRGWTPEERQKLKQQTIDSARHTRAELSALVMHFRDGGGISSVVDQAKPVYKSQDFARKIKRLTEEGELDWLDANEGEAPAEQLTETSHDAPQNAQATPSEPCASHPSSDRAHTVSGSSGSSQAKRAAVLALIHQQVESPGILGRARERPMSKLQFLAQNWEGPGYGWHLGSQTEIPSLKVEDSEEFINLRMSTRHAPVWHDLDNLRELMTRIVTKRREAIDWIEDEASAKRGLTISSDPRIPWGSLTPDFAWSVYYRGFQELLGLADGPRTYSGNFPRNQFQKYMAVQSSRLQTPPKLGWQSPPPNIPFYFLAEEGQLAVIGYWPKTAYPSRITKLHGCLIDELAEAPRAREILAIDKDLKEGVAKFRERLCELL